MCTAVCGWTRCISLASHAWGKTKNTKKRGVTGEWKVWAHRSVFISVCTWGPVCLTYMNRPVAFLCRVCSVSVLLSPFVCLRIQLPLEPAPRTPLRKTAWTSPESSRKTLRPTVPPPWPPQGAPRRPKPRSTPMWVPGKIMKTARTGKPEGVFVKGSGCLTD